MKRLEKNSGVVLEEILPVLKILDWLHLLSKEDKNALGWK